MVNLKKIIAFALTMMMSVSASAASVEISDASVGEVTVTVIGRNKGENINILVAEDDYTLSDLESDLTKVQHQGSIVSGGTGTDKYVFRLNLPENFESADYNVFVNGEEAVQFYYLPFKSVLKIVNDIILNVDQKYDNDKNGLINDVANSLETNKRKLSIANDLFNNADKISVAENLVDSLKSVPISSYADSDKVNEFRNRVKEFACLSCFETNKRDVLFDAGGKYLYNDIIKLENLDNDTISVNRLYDTCMTDEGKKAVIDMLFGGELKDSSALQQRYAKAVILNCIKYPVEEGFGFLNSVITSANAQLAGLSISKYLEWTDKSSANRNIMGSATTVTMDNLETTINSACKTTTVLPSSGPSGVTSTMPSGNIVVPQGNKENNEGNDTAGFSDITGHWAMEKIIALSDKGIISGYPDGTFKPDSPITREEVCKIVAEAFDKESDATIDYVDVNPNDWFYSYVRALSGCGIIDGLGNGIFGTGMNMNRESFAVLIYRLMEFDETAKNVNFADAEEIAEWAVTAVGVLADKGILEGFDDGSFRPQDLLTRSQVASVIYSILDTKEG